MSFTVTVTNVAEGQYFLRSPQSGEILTESGTGYQIDDFTNGDDQLFVLDRVDGEYYSIKSVESGKYLTVSGNSTANNADVIQSTLASTGFTSGQLWKFEPTADGRYKIYTKAVNESGSTTKYVLTSGSSNGVKQSSWDDNSTYYDEWKLIRLMPTSGYEIEYNPSLWNNATVKSETNCYSYALNNQIHPIDNVLKEMQPGEGANYVLQKEYLTADLIIDFVSADSDRLGFVFQAVEKYAVCAEGTYKVALVIDEYNDYHWYRQNLDGSWSHKLGSSSVNILDASNEIILDPETADRDYGDYNYEIFAGFFQISPLNNISAS